MATDYRVQLPHFQGPFDLLLFFIQRDELDIHDIPIFQLTTDFLAYVHQLEEMDIDVASEFILVASTLMRIKAKMLIPRRELDEVGNEIDPREELVQRILEYKMYKETLEEFKKRESDRSSRHQRLNLKREVTSIGNIALIDVELESLSLYKLMKTYGRLLEKYEDRNRIITHKVAKYTWTISGTKKDLKKQLSEYSGKVNFTTIFEHCQNRLHTIFYFLSILELAQSGGLRIHVGESYNSLWIENID